MTEVALRLELTPLRLQTEGTTRITNPARLFAHRNRLTMIIDAAERETQMARAKLSSNHQIVIPKDIRARMDIRPGQELQAITKGGIVTLVPVKPLASMRGFVRGMKTTGFREKKDRF